MTFLISERSSINLQNSILYVSFERPSHKKYNNLEQKQNYSMRKTTFICEGDKYANT